LSRWLLAREMKAQAVPSGTALRLLRFREQRPRIGTAGRIARPTAIGCSRPLFDRRDTLSHAAA
jgi:hypothetical protein